MSGETAIACVGDLMLELFAPEQQSHRAQRTVKLDHADAAVGGAALNLCWYFDQLHRASAMIAAYGTAERGRVEEALSKAHIAITPLVELASVTDILVVLPGKNLPAAYVRGRIGDRDLATLAGELQDDGVIIFGGSRHQNFRKMILEKVSRRRKATFVFSPSYSIYDFEREELSEFMTVSDITAVNQHEAEYLVELLSKSGNAELMQLPRGGGVITLGPGGADLFGPSQTYHVPSISGRDEDVIGTGEAFLAGFLHEYLESGNWQRSGFAGCSVAAQVVQARPREVRTRIDVERLRNDISAFPKG